MFIDLVDVVLNEWTVINLRREMDSLSDEASDDDMPLMLPTESGGSIRKVSQSLSPPQPDKPLQERFIPFLNDRP